MPRVLMTGAAGGIGTSLRKLLPPIYPDLVLSDLKAPADLASNEKFKAAGMIYFARWCGGTLARAHARSGEPATISGYLGKADTFDRAIAAFAVAYADQVERDYKAFKRHQGDGVVSRIDT